LLVSMSHQYGITFVLVTHDNELASYADRIITIKDGALVSDRINPKPAYLLSDEDVEKRLALPDTELTSKHLTDCGDFSPPPPLEEASPPLVPPPEQASPEQAEPEQASPEQASPEQAEPPEQERQENPPSIKTDAATLIRADLIEKSKKLKNLKNKLTSKGKGETHES
ncbi:MAG: hypothetical protein RRY40_03045, partial [Oscillospiraceae bacterium]